MDTGKKLSKPQRMQVLALLARGDSGTKINEFLTKEYGITLSEPTFHDMRKRHADTITAMRDTIEQHVVADIASLQAQSNRILGKKLARAERDMTELELLDQQYRNNEIDSAEYKRKKSTLLNVSITEISMVSKNMHDQTKKSADDDSPALPAGNPRATEALLDAIKRGDTVELQRIVLNPAG